MRHMVEGIELGRGGGWLTCFGSHSGSKKGECLLHWEVVLVLRVREMGCVVVGTARVLNNA